MIAKKQTCSSMFLAFALGFMVQTVVAAPITTGTLLDEMVDMRRLADFPEPAYKTVQFSSYDRTSNLPGGPEWFANSDGFGNEPIPNFEAVLKEPGADGVGEYLICDVKAPGVIVRVWTARIEGTIRMYLDDMERPVYDGPAEEFFMRPYNGFAKAAGVDPALLEGTFNQRNAAYCPIGFSRRCRIVWIGNAKRIHFYQMQIRIYEPRSAIVTFQPGDLKTYESQLVRTAKVLADPDGAFPYTSQEEPIAFSKTVHPGKFKRLVEMKGPRAIERLTLELKADHLDKALRQSVLHIHFDDFPWGQVQCPVGDFFGAAPGINPLNQLPFTVRPDGTMVCRFVMPFARSCQIRLQNLGDQDIRISGSVLPLGWKWDDKRSMHFRARWRVDHDMVAGRPPEDIPFLIANGQGVYVGTTSILLNPNNIPTAGGNWWGEGDEKIFVDEDIQPSTFGTGSEDYYNYAWSQNDIFIFPYCGQPRNDGPANRGFVTNNRWHILDALPFRQRLSFYMELFHHEETDGFVYARTGYHYARPGLMDDHLAITRADVRELKLPDNWQPAARGGAHRSVFYQVEDQIKDKTGIDFVQDNLWSGGRLMVWRPAKAGDQLEVPLPIQEDGRYRLMLVGRLAPGSGKMSVHLKGKKVSGEQLINLWLPHQTLSRIIFGHETELSKGEHPLTLRYEGGEGNEIGIDFLWIQRL